MAEQRLGRYRLTRKIIGGDPIRGVPELWHAEDAGDNYFIKIWRKSSDDNSTIQALWNREVRGLMRLQGYPGAGEMFVTLRDLDYDGDVYYAVMDGGRAMLLADVLLKRTRYPWLMNLGEIGRRRPLWEGLLRIAEALNRHRKVKGLRPKLALAASSHAACRRANSLHICMAAVLSSR